MVATLCRGSRVRFGVAPAASVTAIVSPIARDTASTSAAAMPDAAAGATILSVTSALVIPRAYAPSRRLDGTADRASSTSEATIGTIMIPTTMAADAALEAWNLSDR